MTTEAEVYAAYQKTAQRMRRRSYPARQQVYKLLQKIHGAAWVALHGKQINARLDEIEQAAGIGREP